MFCIKCGTNLPEEAGFCTKCGAKTYKNENNAQDNQSHQQIVVETNQPNNDMQAEQEQQRLAEQAEYNRQRQEQIKQQESKQQLYNQPRVKVIENFLSYDMKNLLEQYGLNQVIFAKYAINNNTSHPCVGEITFFETGFTFISDKKT